MSTLSFSFLMSMQKNLSSSTEMSMKYFILQSSSSAGILMSIMTMKNNPNLMSMTVTLLLLFKVGAAPLHSWLMSISAKLSWNLIMTISTWQKIIPIWMMSMANPLLMITMSMLTITIGTLSQYKNKNSKMLIIYSSVANMTWIMLALPLTMKLLTTFCVTYFTSLMVITWLISMKVKNNMFLMKKSAYMLTVFLAILTLSGMPPTAVFAAKWLLFKELMNTNNFFLGMTTMILTAVNFYVYLRLSMSSVSMKESQHYMTLKAKKVAVTMTAYLSITGGILMAV